MYKMLRHFKVLLLLYILLVIDYKSVKCQKILTVEDLGLPEIPTVSIPLGTTVIPAIKPDGFCNILFNTDYTDPKTYLETGRPNTTDYDQECCKLCQDTVGCNAWAYYKYEDLENDRKPGECWLSANYIKEGRPCNNCASVTFEELDDTLDIMLDEVYFDTQYGLLNDPEKTYTDSAELCLDLCEKTKDCIAWSYVKITYIQESLKEHMCFLRAFAPSFVASPATISGVSLQMKLQMCQPKENICLDSEHGYLNTASESITQSNEECAYLCQRVPECRSWVRIKTDINGQKEGECVLRDWVPMETTCDYADSGVDGGLGSTENVILIIADDLGIDHLGLYAPLIGDEQRDEYPYTPNLVKLAEEGVLFNYAYGNPTCSPSRSTILSGQYGFRNGVGYPIGQVCQDGMAVDISTLPRMLPDYVTTCCIGKWHMSSFEADLDIPRVMGFDRFEGFIDGTVQNYYSWDKTVNGDPAETTYEYCTTDMVDAIKRFFQSQELKKWFLWMGFNAPHTPIHLPPYDLHYHKSLVNDTDIIEADPIPYFHAMIEALDTEIGRIWDFIPIQIQERTTIIFIGDNGSPPDVSDGHPFDSDHAKETLNEGGVHIPFLVSGAGVRNRGRISDDLVNVVDIFATVLGLFRVEIPEDFVTDSVSLFPVMDDQKDYIKRSYAYSEAFGPGKSCDNPGRGFEYDYGHVIRNQRFKLWYPFYYYNESEVEGGGEYSGVPIMYDLSIDPWEKVNLLDDCGEFRHELDTFQKIEAMEQKVYLDKLLEFMNMIKSDFPYTPLSLTNNNLNLNDLNSDIISALDDDLDYLILME